MMEECTSNLLPFKANCKCRMLYEIVCDGKEEIICDHDWEQCGNVKWLEEKKEYVIVDEEDCKSHQKDNEAPDPVMVEIARLHNEYGDALHLMNFYNLLEKRLNEYKDTPYQGKFIIGHFLGIKKNIDDDPYQYEDHVVGLIEDYKEETDGHISTYVLSKPDNTDVTVPVEMTYRIY